MDKITREQRSHIMSTIRSRNTVPELSIKKALANMHFTYQPKGLCGNPDFANRKEKIAIFVDGCFWHGCKKHFKQPTSNINFWRRKISKNMQRDRRVVRTLRARGWKVIRVWEHDVMENPAKLLRLFQEITNE